MCQLCGCVQYIEQGEKTVLKRVVEVVRELGLNSQNVDDYEATEMISGLIAPFGARDDEVFHTAAWISNLHNAPLQGGREKRYQACIRAFRDIFARLPARGSPRDVATAFHQLEQLARDLGDPALASLDPEVRETIKAVQHVHDDIEGKVAELKARYGL